MFKLTWPFTRFVNRDSKSPATPNVVVTPARAARNTVAVTPNGKRYHSVRDPQTGRWTRV